MDDRGAKQLELGHEASGAIPRRAVVAERLAELFGRGRERRQETQSWRAVNDNTTAAILNTRLHYLQTGVKDWATTKTVALSITDQSRPHATVAESLEVVFDMEDKRERVDSVRLVAPSYETVSPDINAVAIQPLIGGEALVTDEGDAWVKWVNADSMKKIEPEEQAAVEDIVQSIRDYTNELWG